jgi:RsiW-degrading membrane proteinase PrsW (M82 family)
MEFLLLLFLGLIPGIFWLFFSLRQDDNKEPPSLLLRVFLVGMLSAIIAMVIESLGFSLIERIAPIISPSLFSVLFLVELFVIIALVEELAKYGAVRFTVFKKPDFDEPVDAMVYMVVAALGFATMENMFVFLGFIGTILIPQELFTYFTGRFLFATPIHVIASGFLGYFMALGMVRKNVLFLPLGIIIATLLHGLYNFSILESTDGSAVFALLPFLITLSCILLICFYRLKKIQVNLTSS